MIDGDRFVRKSLEDLNKKLDAMKNKRIEELKTQEFKFDYP